MLVAMLGPSSKPTCSTREEKAFPQSKPTDMAVLMLIMIVIFLGAGAGLAFMFTGKRED